MEAKLARQLDALAADPAPRRRVRSCGAVREPGARSGGATGASRRACALAPGYLAGTLLIRAAAFHRVGPFDTRWQIGNFIDWYLRAQEAGLRDTMLPEVLLRRRLHARQHGNSRAGVATRLRADPQGRAGPPSESRAGRAAAKPERSVGPEAARPPLSTAGNCWPTSAQRLLLRAALLRGPEALAAWQQLDAGRWTSTSWMRGRFASCRSSTATSSGRVVRDPLMGKLKGVYRHTWYGNQLRLRDAAVVLGELHRRGIEPMLLKGAALTLLHYRDFGLRPMEDVDVLVRTHQWQGGRRRAHRSGMDAERCR